MNRDKKISFGFNKLNKKTPLLQNKHVEKNKVELIECVEGQSIKIKDAPQVIDKPLVIPLKNKKELFGRSTQGTQKESSKQKENDEDNRPDSELTIEELAARELIKDAKNRLTGGDSSTSLLVLPVGGNSIEEEQEPTLDDYEKIPISDYGMAMLRGMGWKEGMGIGKKSSKSQMTKIPELRPKGLGLGASKIVQSEIPSDPARDRDGNTLILKKGSYAKIIAGPHKGDYCEVQGLDEEAGRVIVKTSLQAENLTVNELFIVPVTKEEYQKNSRVLNIEKYEEYKKIADKNLENQRSSQGTKSEDRIKKENDSSRSRKEKECLGSHRNNQYNSGSYEKIDGTYRGQNKYSKNKNEEKGSNSSDNTKSEKTRKEKKRNSDSRERSRHRKEDKERGGNSSDDTDSEGTRKYKKSTSDSRERSRYQKEEHNHRSRYKESSGYKEKNKSRKDKSRLKHGRSNSSSSE